MTPHPAPTGAGRADGPAATRLPVVRIRMVSALARVAAASGAALLLMVVVAGPALAHGRSSDSTNYDTRILEEPELGQTTWRTYGGDEYVAVTNDGAQQIEVLGYDGEPYLRIGPDGVFRNRLSSATYVNADRYANVAVPAFVDPDAEPEWEQVSGASSWYWHDHRTHWMSPTLPPVVRAAPGDAQVVQEWEIPLRIDGQPALLGGELRWVPGPSPVPWLLAAAVVTVPALVGLRRRSGGAAALVRPAAVVLAGVAALNVLHLVDDLFAAPAPLSAKLLAAGQTALFIAVTAFGAVRGWQAREGAFTALGVGSVAAFVGQGLLYLPALTSSQLESLVPDALGRFAIAVSLVQLVPVGIVAVIGSRRHQVAVEPPADEGGHVEPRQEAPVGMPDATDAPGGR